MYTPHFLCVLWVQFTTLSCACVPCDFLGHTPALCCATNAQVARCLKLILDVSPLAFAAGTVTGPSACPDMPSPPLSEEEEENFTH